VLYLPAAVPVHLRAARAFRFDLLAWFCVCCAPSHASASTLCVRFAGLTYPFCCLAFQRSFCGGSRTTFLRFLLPLAVALRAALRPYFLQHRSWLRGLYNGVNSAVPRTRFGFLPPVRAHIGAQQLRYRFLPQSLRHSITYNAQRAWIAPAEQHPHRAPAYNATPELAPVARAIYLRAPLLRHRRAFRVSFSFLRGAGAMLAPTALFSVFAGRAHEPSIYNSALLWHPAGFGSRLRPLGSGHHLGSACSNSGVHRAARAVACGTCWFLRFNWFARPGQRRCARASRQRLCNIIPHRWTGRQTTTVDWQTNPRGRVAVWFCGERRLSSAWALRARTALRLLRRWMPFHAALLDLFVSALYLLAQRRLCGICAAYAPLPFLALRSPAALHLRTAGSGAGSV